MEREDLGKKLEELYVRYIRIEKCINRLKEIKKLYLYKHMRTKPSISERKSIIVETDVQRDRQFLEMTEGCDKFNVEDSFWTEVSNVFRTSRNECYNKWINRVVDFDKKLHEVDIPQIELMIKDGKDWLEISKEIRCSPFNVFSGYICFTRDKRLKLWTKEEDELLELGVMEYGTSKWRYVSKIVGTRTGKECAMRFYFLNKSIKKGKWSKEEEARLLVATKMYGRDNWKRISNYVMTRNPIQCRSKYVTRENKNNIRYTTQLNQSMGTVSILTSSWIL